MADEKKLSDEEIKDIAESVAKPDEYPAEQAEAVKESQVGDTATGRVTAEALEATEKAVDSPAVETFGQGVDALQAGVRKAGDTADDEAWRDPHHGDTTVFMGREYNVPLYTSVFFALGVLTFTEVMLAELIASDAKIPLLLGIMVAKALLVVMFYMHLKDDNRVFAVTLAVPVAFATLATLFLLAIPTGY
jgi:caa(3)-type oxidase subunit IV